MDLTLLPTLLELVKANLFITILVSVVYGVLLAWIIRETRLSHQALRDIAAMVRELHRAT
jgi:hypothetical protein